MQLETLRIAADKNLRKESPTAMLPKIGRASAPTPELEALGLALGRTVVKMVLDN
jgi:hypothetical protein